VGWVCRDKFGDDMLYYSVDEGPSVSCSPTSTTIQRLGIPLTEGGHKLHALSDGAPQLHDIWVEGAIGREPRVLFAGRYGELVVLHNEAEPIVKSSLEVIFYVVDSSTGDAIWPLVWPPGVEGVLFSVAGQESFTVNLPVTNNIELNGVEPGTHHLTAVAIDAQGRALGPPSSILLEVILTPSEVARHSHIPPYHISKLPSTPIETQGILPPLKPASVVFVSTLTFDGQKTIWLHQLRLLDRKAFSMSFVTFDQNDQLSDSPVLKILESLDVSCHILPFPPIYFEDLVNGLLGEDPWWLRADDPLYGTRERLTVEQIEARLPTSQKLLNPILLGALDRAGGLVSRIRLPFARRVWEHMVLGLQGADLVVFANARDQADVLLVRAARIAGVKALVMDLPNLFPARGLAIDALIAPSDYALSHPSVTEAFPVSAGEGFKPPRREVIVPGVNTTAFDPDRVTPNCIGSIAGPSFPGGDSSTPPPGLPPGLGFRCGLGPRVGFLARLASEKSPGLFLSSARLVAKQWPHASFVVLGDGPMRKPLEEFGARLGLRSRLHFTGGVYDQSALASLLASLDVMVNPSLRAWSETLCIANVEAMAMRLPVVTFGVGGVGEYVRGAQTAGSLTRPECHDQRSLGAADLSGTAGSCPVEAPASRPLEMNSVVAASGTAEGLASGVLWLLENATRREAIGRRAQATVNERFTIEAMVRKYDALYRDLLMN